RDLHSFPTRRSSDLVLRGLERPIPSPIVIVLFILMICPCVWAVGRPSFDDGLVTVPRGHHSGRISGTWLVHQNRPVLPGRRRCGPVAVTGTLPDLALKKRGPWR